MGMRRFLQLSVCLLTASCQPAAEVDAPKARTMWDDMGGRLFFIESMDRHEGKRAVLILACHGDGDNTVMFQTQVVLPAPPPPPGLFFAYRAGPTKAQAEAAWVNKDIWIFKDGSSSQKAANLFLRTAEIAVRFPEETHAPRTATWRLSTAADLQNVITGWCVKPAAGR
jgi:hypothetical protein